VEDGGLEPLADFDATENAASTSGRCPECGAAFWRSCCLLAADILKEQGYDVRAFKPGYKALVLKGFVKAKE
jgi:hypothetical protein